MAQDKKQLLIVDDTEIDRIILKSILNEDYAVHEAVSGSMAFEYITGRVREQLDGILLDISMPNIDGFDVLQFMKEKGIEEIPVFLITAEPTRENVLRARQYGVSEFIIKPFVKDDLLRRLRSRLGVIPVYDPEKDNIKVCREYINDLQTVYRTYLTNMGKTDVRCQVMSDLMQILLTRYNHSREVDLNADSIELISKAAFFCDIGEMVIPDRRLQAILGKKDSEENAANLNHNIQGSNIIRLNRSPECGFFVEICSSMCLRHHERWDGQGFPDGIVGKNNSIYNQMCRLLDAFEQRRSKFYGNSAMPVKFVIKRLLNDDPGMVSPKVYDLMEDCELEIVDYFRKAKF